MVPARNISLLPEHFDADILATSHFGFLRFGIIAYKVTMDNLQQEVSVGIP